eukprot:1563835-Amphidinium_carterae.1
MQRGLSCATSADVQTRTCAHRSFKVSFIIVTGPTVSSQSGQRASMDAPLASRLRRRSENEQVRGGTSQDRALGGGDRDAAGVLALLAASLWPVLQALRENKKIQ